MGAPSKNRMAILTWLIVYPLITLLLAILDPLLAGVPMPLRTLVLSAIMVPTLVYFALPAATSKLSNWLHPRTPASLFPPCAPGYLPQIRKKRVGP